MNSDTIIKNARKYYELLKKDFPPERVDAAYKGDDRIVWLKHACWLAQHIPCLLLIGEIGKAKRWQSCLHGYMQSRGLMSVMEAQLDSMPPGSVYNRDA